MRGLRQRLRQELPGGGGRRDQTHTFDSFECAIHKRAPICEHCDCKVIGHGIEVEGRFYCCAHCAQQAEGDVAVDDRVG